MSGSRGVDLKTDSGNLLAKIQVIFRGYLESMWSHSESFLGSMVMDFSGAIFLVAVLRRE